MIKEHSQIIVLTMGVLDLAVTGGIWVLCLTAYVQTGWFAPLVAPTLRTSAHAIVVTLLLTVLVFSRMGLYRPRRTHSRLAEALDLVRACAVVWLLVAVAGHLLPEPRTPLGLQLMFLGAWPAAMIAYRGSARSILRALRRRGRNTRSTVIIGAGRLGQKLFHTFQRQSWTGYDVRYFVDDHRVGGTLLGVPVRGPISELPAILREHPVDAAFVSLPHNGRRPAEVLDLLSGTLVDVNVVPDLLSYHFLSHEVSQLGTLPIVNLTHSPQCGWNAALKRGLDVVFSLIALIVLSPLMLAIAAAVRLTSPGPALFRQRRASLGGKEFDMLKFRSMVADAEVHNGHEWSTDRDDPRITPIGKALRRLNLDELPQLINVLKGDMSLVGPRPEQPHFIERFSRQMPGYLLRHHVKAGITGWAQVHGYRGRTDLQKRIQYDLDYINRWSIGFDLRILLLTVLGGVRIGVHRRHVPD